MSVKKFSITNLFFFFLFSNKLYFNSKKYFKSSTFISNYAKQITKNLSLERSKFSKGLVFLSNLRLFFFIWKKRFLFTRKSVVKGLISRNRSNLRQFFLTQFFLFDLFALRSESFFPNYDAFFTKSGWEASRKIFSQDSLSNLSYFKNNLFTKTMLPYFWDQIVFSNTKKTKFRETPSWWLKMESLFRPNFLYKFLTFSNKKPFPKRSHYRPPGETRFISISKKEPPKSRRSLYIEAFLKTNFKTWSHYFEIFEYTKPYIIFKLKFFFKKHYLSSLDYLLNLDFMHFFFVASERAFWLSYITIKSLSKWLNLFYKFYTFQISRLLSFYKIKNSFSFLFEKTNHFYFSWVSSKWFRIFSKSLKIKRKKRWNSKSFFILFNNLKRSLFLPKMGQRKFKRFKYTWKLQFRRIKPFFSRLAICAPLSLKKKLKSFRRNTINKDTNNLSFSSNSVFNFLSETKLLPTNILKECFRFKLIYINKAPLCSFSTQIKQFQIISFSPKIRYFIKILFVTNLFWNLINLTKKNIKFNNTYFYFYIFRVPVEINYSNFSILLYSFSLFKENSNLLHPRILDYV